MRTNELMNMKGAELIQIAKELGLTVYTNKEGTQLKESKKAVVAKIEQKEAELAEIKADEETAEAVKEEVEAIAEETETVEEAVEETAEETTEEAVEVPEIKEEKKQPRKTRRGQIYEYNGKALTLTEWAKELNMPSYVLWDRLNWNKWTVERALSTPLRANKKTKEQYR